MSQCEWTKKHKENHPESESRRKESQRCKELLTRFYIKRNHLYGYGYPATIDQNSDVFKRVYRRYMEECEQSVEIEEVVK